MSGLSRRDVLRSGGLFITIGAITAACGSNDAGGTPGNTIKDSGELKKS